jgi:sugar phosphate isomerase/epimerase
MQPKIGLIGVVGEDMSRDFWGTMARLAALGYEGVEFGGPTLDRAGVSADEFRKRMDDLGLAAISSGSQKYRIEGKEAETIAAARDMGCSYLSFYWGPCESKEQVLEDAALYNRIGQRCKEAGLQLTYHNHNHEFQKFDGEMGFDILMGATEPDLVHSHMDTGWVEFGGVDPAALVRKYAGRCAVLHLRDILSLEGGNTSNDGRDGVTWTELGKGILNLQSVVDAAKETGVQWLTVEDGSPEGVSPWDSAEISLRHLQALRG